MKADLEPPDAVAGAEPMVRPPEIQAIIDALVALEQPQLHQRLREAIVRKDVAPEALLHLARQARARRDNATFFLAFEALTKRAMPMIASRMRTLYGIGHDDLADHTSIIFEKLFLRIEANDKVLDFGECNFRTFILRRSQDAIRSKDHPWTPRFKNAVKALRKERGKSVKRTDGDGQRAPIEADPRILSQADDPAERAAGQEELDDVDQRLEGLPEKALEAFMQWRVLKLTQEELATQFNVTERTVRNWIERVATALGERDTP